MHAAESALGSADLGGPILVVGGDLPTRRWIRRALAGEGLPVEAVAGGWHGLMLALIRRPALVILDPSLSGLEAEDLVAGLQVAYGAAVPLVVVSGDQRVLSRARRLGACAAVAGPSAPAVLLDAAQRALDAGAEIARGMLGSCALPAPGGRGRHERG